ncbi:MAG: type 4a pilus biogenesis protein PilO [Porticoccaceae bacterium]|nr:type 4a pilus biogenesis protein PilO [Porticoccaceae bacterium]
MATDTFKAKDLEISEFNIENIGMWPVLYRGLVCAIVLVLILVLGYFLQLKDLYVVLDSAIAKEKVLRASYEEKAFEVANLEAYRIQMAELEESFSVLLGQLPGDTEVPGLLEDITDLGYGSSLEIKTISLQPEKAKEFYVELPIKIVAEGGYHDVATFVSGVAGLPRIVTLHDYSLKFNKGEDRQVFELEAKTYRYKGEED